MFYFIGHVPIRLELGLFECTSWYARSPINFMSDEELVRGGYNIDTRFRSQTSDLRPLENEYQYYDRSKDAMKKIIELHRKTGGTVLLVAHAPSLEVLTRHLMKGQPRPERLAELSGKVDFCSMTIIERESPSKPWQFRYSLDENANRGVWQQQQEQQQKQPQQPQQPSNSSLNHPKAANVAIPAANYQLQPQFDFTNYLSQALAAPQKFQFHFVPQQEAYPPYFAL